MRAWLGKKFQKLVSEYNTGSKAADDFLHDLLDFVGELNNEERRGLRENLSEEELAIFDILTQPDPELNPQERQFVKAMLARLKADKLILDGRLRERAKAAVRVAIEESLDKLPPVYGDELWGGKVGRTYQWVFERY